MQLSNLMYTELSCAALTGVIAAEYFALIFTTITMWGSSTLRTLRSFQVCSSWRTLPASYHSFCPHPVLYVRPLSPVPLPKHIHSVIYSALLVFISGLSLFLSCLCWSLESELPSEAGNLLLFLRFCYSTPHHKVGDFDCMIWRISPRSLSVRIQIRVVPL